MDYVMIAKNIAIAFVEADKMPIWGDTLSGDKVTAIEVESFDGIELGMTYDAETDTFYFPPQPEPEPEDDNISTTELLETMAFNIEYLVALQDMEGGEK